MKPLRVALVVLFLASGLPGRAVPARAHDGDNDDVELLALFHDPLVRYGDWIHFERRGWSWVPHVARSWHPYASGRWTLTDDGWTWASDEPWGWATNHYGRWFFDRSHGWAWVPGPIWGPAWVSWRCGGGVVGWAPLAPGVEAMAPRLDAAPDPSAFSFVEERFLLEPDLRRHLLPRASNAALVARTKDVTRYAVTQGRFVDGGVDAAEIERAVGHSIARLPVPDLRRPPEPGGSRVPRPPLGAASGRPSREGGETR